MVAARGLDTSGRGLTIVTLLSRDWGVNARTDGKSVWAEFDLSERVSDVVSRRAAEGRWSG